MKGNSLWCFLLSSLICFYTVTFSSFFRFIFWSPVIPSFPSIPHFFGFFFTYYIWGYEEKKVRTTSNEDKVFCATANDCRVTIANIHRLDLLVTEHPQRITSTTTASKGERRRKKNQIICELVLQVFHFYTNRARTRSKQRNLRVKKIKRDFFFL